MLVWKTYSNNIFYIFIDIIWLIFYRSQEKIHLYFQMVFGWLTSLVFQVPTSLIRYVKGKSENKHTWFSAVMSLYGNQKWLFSCRENWTNRICRFLLGHDKYVRIFFFWTVHWNTQWAHSTFYESHCLNLVRITTCDYIPGVHFLVYYSKNQLMFGVHK